MTTAPVPPGSAPRRARSSGAGRQVRSAAVATLAVGLLLVVLALVLGGPDAAAGAATGAGVVVVFFAAGAVVVNAVASVSPAASLLVAMLTYLLEVVLVAVVLRVLDASGALDGPVDRTWAGGAVVAATLTWLVAQIRSAVRAREPLYDLPDRPGQPAPADASRGQEASAR
jgi:ATP synthase protein I